MLVSLSVALVRLGGAPVDGVERAPRGVVLLVLVASCRRWRCAEGCRGAALNCAQPKLRTLRRLPRTRAAVGVIPERATRNKSYTP